MALRTLAKVAVWVGVYAALVWLVSDSYQDTEILVWLAVVLLFGVALQMGLGLLAVRLLRWFTDRRPQRIFPAMKLRNVVRLQRHRPMPLIKEMPNFGLIYGTVLFVLVIIFSMFEHLTPRGLFLSFKQQNVVAGQKSPWPETMSVYVDGARGFTVNGQAVVRERLRVKLQEELSRRAVWTVYFEADRDSLYMDAVYSMDTIQGLGAKVIWITPKTREKWDRERVQ
jgi:biopolymer transport protein ExbD